MTVVVVCCTYIWILNSGKWSQFLFAVYEVYSGSADGATYISPNGCHSSCLKVFWGTLGGLCCIGRSKCFQNMMDKVCSLLITSKWQTSEWMHSLCWSFCSVIVAKRRQEQHGLNCLLTLSFFPFSFLFLRHWSKR